MNGSKVVQLEGAACEVIHSYSRAEAIADGVLVDVSETAKEAGIRYPLVLTRSVWEMYVSVPEGVLGQDEDGRLWDILWMTRCSIQFAPLNASTVKVLMYVRNDNIEPKRVELKAVVGPGDAGEPVITVSLPDED